MTMYQSDDNPQPGTAASATVAWTPGQYVAATGKVTPCAAQGDPCDFIFNDSVDAGKGVGLLKYNVGNPGLAHGAVTAGHEVCVGIGTDDLPKFMDVDDADTGDIIVGRCTGGTSATAEDLPDEFDVINPSLAIEIYPPQAQRAKPAP